MGHKMKIKKGEFTIKNPHGDRTLSGYYSENLGIICFGVIKGWAIIHLASGSPITYDHYLKKAKAKVLALEALPVIWGEVTRENSATHPLSKEIFKILNS